MKSHVKNSLEQINGIWNQGCLSQLWFYNSFVFFVRFVVKKAFRLNNLEISRSEYTPSE